MQGSQRCHRANAHFARRGEDDTVVRVIRDADDELRGFAGPADGDVVLILDVAVIAAVAVVFERKTMLLRPPVVSWSSTTLPTLALVDSLIERRPKGAEVPIPRLFAVSMTRPAAPPPLWMITLEESDLRTTSLTEEEVDHEPALVANPRTA